MSDQPIHLRALRMEDEQAFRRAVRESRAVDPGSTFAFGWNDGVCFADYVARLQRWAEGADLSEGFVPNTYLVGVVGNGIVGRVSIRHELNDFLARIGGHIGYGVIPSQRRRGYATAMLKLALPMSAALGITRVLLTCDIDNIASRRVIERNGGVFERLANDPELTIPKRRYWIDISGLG